MGHQRGKGSTPIEVSVGVHFSLSQHLSMGVILRKMLRRFKICSHSWCWTHKYSKRKNSHPIAIFEHSRRNPKKKQRYWFCGCFRSRRDKTANWGRNSSLELLQHFTRLNRWFMCVFILVYLRVKASDTVVCTIW